MTIVRLWYDYSTIESNWIILNKIQLNHIESNWIKSNWIQLLILDSWSWTEIHFSVLFFVDTILDSSTTKRRPYLWNLPRCKNYNLVFASLMLGFYHWILTSHTHIQQQLTTSHFSRILVSMYLLTSLNLLWIEYRPDWCWWYCV